jgi:hypothetical protein
MKNQGNQFEKELTIVNATSASLLQESLNDSNLQSREQPKNKNLSDRLKNFLENLDMSFRRIDAGLM